MKIIKNIIEFILGTSIIWLPIIATIIAEKLSEVNKNNHNLILNKEGNTIWLAIKSK